MSRILSFTFAFLVLATAAFGQFSVPKVLVEEHSGAWCGFCVDGAVRLEQTLKNNPTAIGVTHHNGDAMATAESDDLSAFYVGGYPQATISRQGAAISRGSWSSATTNATGGSTSAEVSFDSLGWDPATLLITARVHVRFTGNESGDLRINMMIIEDSVTGTGNGYNQVNYDNTTVGHPYFGAGDPIVGFVHRHVMRVAIGGAWGVAGIIPNAVTFGDETSFTFNYQADSNWDMTKVHLVAYVARHNGTSQSDRPVLNAEAVHFVDNLTPTNTAIEEPTFASEVKVYPNPATDKVTFTFDLQHNGMLSAEILDPMGKRVAVIANGSLNRGLHSLYWNSADVPNGMYLFRITSENESITRRVMVVK